MKIYTIILLITNCLYSSKCNKTKGALPATRTEKNIDPYSMIIEGESLIREGDMVVRLNQDPASQFIKNFNRHDKSYSHAGMVLFENGYPFVYHIVNGEENPDEKMTKDSLSWFCNPRKNTAFGIYRYKINGAEIKKIKDIVHCWYKKGIQFDYTFNLLTDDKMYCSELISKLLKKATANRISIEPTKLTAIEAGYCAAYMHLPLSYTSEMKVVSIDNLYLNPFCVLIKKYSYQYH